MVRLISKLLGRENVIVLFKIIMQEVFSEERYLILWYNF